MDAEAPAQTQPEEHPKPEEQEQQPAAADAEQPSAGGDDAAAATSDGATPTADQQQQDASSAEDSNNNKAVDPEQQPSSAVVAAPEPAAPPAPAPPPPPPPAPVHPDYLGDCFQECVVLATLPAPFEGWTDILTLPDSALLGRIGAEGAVGAPSSAKSSSVSPVLGSGTLPNELMTHPSRVLLRVLARMNEEYRFLLMRQIDEADQVVANKREQHNSLLDQMRKDNVAKLSATLEATAIASSPNRARSPASGSGGGAGVGGGYDEMVANNAIRDLERRLFTQQSAAALQNRRRSYGGGGSLTQATTGTTPTRASAGGVNESQRLKTYWRSRYQRACIELEEVEQQIAQATNEFYELDNVAGAETPEQLKELIEKCRVAEETAHAFAESCRMEMKRAEIAAGRVESNRNKTGGGGDSSSHSDGGGKATTTSPVASSRGGGGGGGATTASASGLVHSPSTGERGGGGGGGGNVDNNASFSGNNDSMTNNNMGGAAHDDLSNLPFLVESLPQHSAPSVQSAVSIRIKTNELEQMLANVANMKDQCEKMDEAVERAQGEYAAAVGHLPSHISVNFEQVVRNFALLEQAQDAYFDAQAAMTEERFQFTQKRHEGILRMERERCRLMDQANKIRNDLRSAKLDLLRVERKRKDYSHQPVTAKDFTTTANVSVPRATTSVLSTASSSLDGTTGKQHPSGGGSKKNKQQGGSDADPVVGDAAAHLETMRAKMKVYELERQALMLDAMKSGAVAGPQ